MRRSRSRIDVVAERASGKIVRLEVSGHSGFAPASKDIVCAAVSALVLTGAHGVMRHGEAKAHVRDDPEGAYVLEISGGGGARAQAVLETVLDGLRAVARSYPGHLRVRQHSQGRAEAPRKR